ncbi:unnamed protein product [Cuscuta epithymum]|uniref:Uncharacterized protein n=1 Tax=Cuscuta epithymum TaxID=186058 RepID=A0AAV0FKJ3_9ASTE|nr:unnamed protein product [Cuscuta epithymum]
MPYAEIAPEFDTGDASMPAGAEEATAAADPVQEEAQRVQFRGDGGARGGRVPLQIRRFCQDQKVLFVNEFRILKRKTRIEIPLFIDFFFLLKKILYVSRNYIFIFCE